MPQLTNLVLKDHTNTDHTYKPRSISGGVATLVESTGVPIGERRLTLSITRTQTGRQKATLKLAIPVIQDAVVNGVSKPTAVRTAYADVTFTFDGASTTNERLDMIWAITSYFQSTQSGMFIGDLEHYF